VGVCPNGISHTLQACVWHGAEAADQLAGNATPLLRPGTVSDAGYGLGRCGVCVPCLSAAAEGEDDVGGAPARLSRRSSSGSVDAMDAKGARASMRQAEAVGC
jgi:hypothetical protein